MSLLASILAARAAAAERTTRIALVVALLTGLWRVPGGCLVLKNIALDVAHELPHGYAEALILTLACACLVLLAQRGQAARSPCPRLALAELRLA